MRNEHVRLEEVFLVSQWIHKGLLYLENESLSMEGNLQSVDRVPHILTCNKILLESRRDFHFKFSASEGNWTKRISTELLYRW